MMIQSFNTVEAETEREREDARDNLDPLLEADNVWLDAALDWDELETGPVVPSTGRSDL